MPFLISPLLLVIVIVIMVTLFLLNMTEIAIIKVSDEQIEVEASDGNKRALKIMEITKHMRSYQLQKEMTSIIMIFIYVSSLLLHSLMNMAISNIWVTLLPFMMVIVHIIFIQHMSRRLAIKYTNGISHHMVWFYVVILKVTRPITYVIEMLSRGIAVILNLNPDLTDKDMTEEEIRSILTEGTEKGLLDEDETEMIHNVFDFDDTEVQSVMTHRTDIIGLEVSMTLEDVLKIINVENYTRYPIYKETMDEIIGTIHVKDLMPYMIGKRKVFNLKRIMRKPYFIPEFQKISDLLNNMQLTKNHIAIILDEYGGTSGLVTFEDIIEELIGNVSDEFDDDEQDIYKIDDNTYEILGHTTIEDVEDELEIGLDIEAYDTLSGFILDQIGHLPEDDETIEFVFNSMLFKVTSIENHIIEKVIVTRILEESTHE
jgi:putative hemolysin